FLRQGALGDTVPPNFRGTREYVCESCGAQGKVASTLWPKFCLSCTNLVHMPRWIPRYGGVGGVSLMLVMVFIGLTTFDPVRRYATELIWGTSDLPAVTSAEEAQVLLHRATEIRRAIDPRDELTRNTAVQVVSVEAGPFRVEQVAELWDYVR